MTRCKTLAGAIALAAAALATQGSALAQAAMPAPGAGMGGKSGSLSSADRNFLMEAAKGGMAEVQLGQIAQQKGGSDAVKQFGARMVEDHDKANDELKQLASAKGITLPTSAPMNAKMKKLEGMSGNGFDRAYMTEMLADHKKTIALFQTQSNASGGDPDLKAFATKTLPTLQTHLHMVQSDQHGKTTGAASGDAMKP